jgi:type IV pilus assembly protein PilF
MQRKGGLPGVCAAVILAMALAGCATGGGSIHQSDSSSSGQDAARVHTELGWHLMQQGNNKRALEKLQTALTFDANYAPAHTVLGLLYTRIGKPSKAETHYRRAVELEPTDGNTNNNFGRFLCQEGKTREGLPYFRKALADPFYKTRATALTNAGTCHIRAGDYAQAETSLRQALKDNPRYADALYQMARVNYLRNDAFHASAYIQRYQAVGVSNAAALKLGYDIETRLGDVEGARGYARQLRDKFPDSEQAQALNTKTIR